MEANAGAAQHRAEGHGRGLPGDAGALGPGERHRDTFGRGRRAWTHKRKGKKLSNQDWVSPRPRGQDRQDEGRHDPSGLQARARGGSGHRRGGAAELHPADEGDTTTLEKTLRRRPRRISRRWTRHRRPKTRPNVDRQGLSLTVGLKGARRRPLARRGSPSPSRKVLRAGIGDGAARRAVTNKPDPAVIRGQAFKLAEIEIVRAPFAHNLGIAAMRRTMAARARERAQAIPPEPCRGHNLRLPDRKLTAPAPRRRPWRVDIG